MLLSFSYKVLVNGSWLVVTLWLSELVRTRVQLLSLLFSTVTDLFNVETIWKLFLSIPNLRF